MSQSSSPSIPGIGFYTVEYSEALGWTGGYLLLNASGRPLEFHCTLPVKPSKAHEILYGSTLRSHLIGDLLGQSLLKQARIRPQMVCVDQGEALRLADQHEFPFVWVGSGDFKTPPLNTVSLPSATGTLRAEARFASRAEKILENFADLPDFEEPFLRIRDAVREAQQGASAAARAA